MRIISGEFGGRRLKAVPGQSTRPTTDKVKESLFHMIGPYFDGGHALDLYSGSGALGIEAVSRGMKKAYLVDHSHQSIKTINENVKITKEQEKFIVWKKKDTQALENLRQLGESFDLVLLDPPYGRQELEQVVKQILDYQLVNDRAVIVCETDKDVSLDFDAPTLRFIKDKIYGTTRISLYEKVAAE
ncbi:16S rRNA (guanine(966)-N(2))-methyltransferase RsmD [Alkalibacterium putridalgicola]|uniref:16S rRNA (Guanine(966)-N(2))-methyltransferase RsmD n=1 Tax=Alkalibacterium putridalgicola TaxID=426703 RepID=A0A1H7Q7A6_9LACT|nr:16S rRNA (guanine(966)-N(2))-methyltransferase RsmD [Alkalibacterium putridalgicola]GEK88018.1 methylase [Alkalibacterium putridalgicola]SEL43736.1 16S rRNA (guanine(966)-N(2))-methyltransferase RsmD [Alkalibacterium putridalgicola]